MTNNATTKSYILFDSLHKLSITKKAESSHPTDTQ